MPFLQDAVKDVFNYSDTIHISASDFIADGFRSMESDDPYEALAEKMVYCIYNGSVNQRIEEQRNLPTQLEQTVLYFLRTGAVRIQSVHQAL